MEKVGSWALVALFAALLGASYFAALFGPAPLTYDEAWNWTNLAIHGPIFPLIHYPLPNNHVLFTALQALLLPHSLVAWRPLFLRLPNVAIGTTAVAVAYTALKQEGYSKPVALACSLALPFCSLLVFAHFVIARGYLLALVLAFTGLIRWSRLMSSSDHRDAWQGGLLLALSAYSVPTFCFLAASAVAALFVVNIARGSSRIRDLALASGSFLGFTAVLYFRIAKGVLHNRNRFTPPFAQGPYSLRVVELLSSPQGLLIGLLIVALAGYLSIRAVKAPPSDRANLGILLCASALIFLLILELLIATRAIARPFDRNSQFVPFFIWTGILLLSTGARFRAVVLAFFLLNSSFGAVSCLSSEWNHPIVEKIENLYFPATALENYRTLLGSGGVRLLRCEWGAEDACGIYATKNRVAVSALSQPIDPKTPCAVGRTPPESPAEVVVELADGKTGFLCF